MLRDNLKRALRKRDIAHSTALIFINIIILHAYWTKRICIPFFKPLPKEQESVSCTYHPKALHAMLPKIRIRCSTGVQRASGNGAARVIYDHQYGRWYLIGYNGRQGLMKFRMEGLTQIEEGDVVEEEVFQRAWRRCWPNSRIVGLPIPVIPPRSWPDF